MEIYRSERFVGTRTKAKNKILSFHETKHFVLLYVTKNDAHVIQKRMFKSDEDVESFMMFVSKYLSKK
jgi:hypothetical protein